MKVRILWLIAFLLFTVQLSAQQKVTVKGKITDEHNEPVIGANIMEKVQRMELFLILTDFLL